jgi:hypothetical protein
MVGNEHARTTAAIIITLVANGRQSDGWECSTEEMHEGGILNQKTTIRHD